MILSQRLPHRLLLLLFSTFAMLWGAANATERPTLADPRQTVEFEVILPLQHVDELDRLLAQLHDPNSALYHHWLTPAEFTARFGARPDSIDRVTTMLKLHGLDVTAIRAQGVHVRGTVAAVKEAFGVDLLAQRMASGRMRLVTAQSKSLPAELANEGAHITGFARVLEHRTHAHNLGRIDTLPKNRTSPIGFYWFDDIKQAYDFPSYTKVTGKGRTIAIVMASDVLDSDMALYFGHENFPPPTIVREPILGGSPFNPDNGASFEASLDVQQSYGMAPGATIMLYNTPDLSDNSILSAYLQILEDNEADIVSSSFGEAEGFYTAAYNGGEDFTYYLQIYNSLFKQGNAQGITFVASSGDSGGLALPSVDYVNNPAADTAVFLRGVETPASDPNVTAVGGTNLVTTYSPPSLVSKYVSENADGDPEIPYDPYDLGGTVSGGYWGAGGGVSVIWSAPAYQQLVPTHSHMRTVPDFGMQVGGCPAGISVLPCGPNRSAVVLGFNGAFYGVIGTSVSAPETAGLLALLEQRLGGVRLGNANYLLYTEGATQAFDPMAGYFHTNIPGFNGAEYTHPIYNEIIGVGTPFGRNVILDPTAPAAGNPQTPSNP